MLSNPLITLCSILLAAGSLALWAADRHQGHNNTMTHKVDTAIGTTPVEGGQATFAALIEIISILEQDPDTDWNQVNIDGLRAHLLDMDHLMRNSTAQTSLESEKVIKYHVTGEQQSIAAIHRMVPAHAGFIEQSRNWAIATQINTDGATVTITADNPAAAKKLIALGFYGFMSLDSHHQAHHLQMANGMSH